jgi:hypothetical protein
MLLKLAVPLCADNVDNDSTVYNNGTKVCPHPGQTPLLHRQYHDYPCTSVGSPLGRIHGYKSFKLCAQLNPVECMACQCVTAPFETSNSCDANAIL